MKQTQAQADRAYERTQAQHKKEAEDSIVRAAMRVLGKRGGKAKSKAKSAASKKNGAKGGRPKKAKAKSLPG